MGPKISTGTGQSTKLGSDHRHLKSGLVTFHPTILIFLLFKILSSVLKKNWTEEKTALFKFVWKKNYTACLSNKFLQKRQTAIRKSLYSKDTT